MSHYLLIAAGGALGAMARYGMGTAVQARVGSMAPVGTMSVNILGCLLMGIVAGGIGARVLTHPHWRSFVAIGLLGGFTTFSSFGYETFALVEDGRWDLALMNVLVSTLAGLAALWIGVILIRSLAS